MHLAASFTTGGSSTSKTGTQEGAVLSKAYSFTKTMEAPEHCPTSAPPSSQSSALAFQDKIVPVPTPCFPTFSRIIPLQHFRVRSKIPIPTSGPSLFALFLLSRCSFLQLSLCLRCLHCYSLLCWSILPPHLFQAKSISSARNRTGTTLRFDVPT